MEARKSIGPIILRGGTGVHNLSIRKYADALVPSTGPPIQDQE